MSTPSPLFPPLTGPFTIRSNTPASYVIWFDGLNYHADSMTGGIDQIPAADPTSLIQAAFNSLTSGGRIFFKTATYPLSTGLTIPNTTQRVTVLGGYGAILKPNANMTADVLTLNASDSMIEGLAFDMSNTGVTGSIIASGVANTAQRNTIRNCNLFPAANCTHGIKLGASSGVYFVYNNRVQSSGAPTGSGILVSGSDHHIFENDVGGFGLGGGITLSNAGDVAVIGNQIYVNFTGIDCYLPNNYRIVGNHVGFNLHHGIFVHSDTAGSWFQIPITGNVIEANGTALANTYDGIHFTATAGTISNADVVGNIIVDRQGTQTQRYGIRVDDVNLTNSLINSNIVANNLSAGISAPTIASSLIITNNPGFNPQGFTTTTPAVPATGVDQQNTNGYPVRILILTIGTVTAYQITDPNSGIQAVTTTLQAGQEITLDPGAKIRFTYTGAPTWKWYGI